MQPSSDERTRPLSCLPAWLIALAVVAALGPATGRAQMAPEAPRATVDTSLPPPPTRVIAVGAGGSFQAALDAVQPGEAVELAAGEVFTGNFTLPAKAGSGVIVIRTSAPDASLPPPGTRITPAYAPAMARIVTPNSGPAIKTAPGAHHYRLVGLEITMAAGVAANTGLVALGDWVQTTAAQVPHHIVLDRVWVHGNATGNLRRGIALNSAATAVIDSYVSEAHDRVEDAQAICGWNGPGPFKLVNNYLEGSGENVMFGGGDPTIPGLVPSDIEIRGNHLAKPLSWRAGDPSYAGIAWAVKNLFELKNAQRVLIDGNVFERNWAHRQDGIAILFTVRNQDGGAPWSVVQDVTFTNNVVRHAGGGISLLGLDTNHPSQRTSRVLIRNNVFEDLDGARWGGRGRLLQMMNGTADVVVEHVTALQTGDVLGADLAANAGFVLRDSIAPDNGFGVVGTGGSLWNLATYFPGAVVVNNALAGGSPTAYPAGNFFPPSLAEVGFADLIGGDYRLAPSSAYVAAATDGTDLGADIDAILAATARVVSGGGPEPPEPPDVPGPDLLIVSVTTAVAAVRPGGTLATTSTVRNQGDAATVVSTLIRYYLVPEAPAGGAIRLGATTSVPALPSGTPWVGSVSLLVPATVRPGQYVLRACADDTARVAESDETNNCAAAAGMVDVTQPDLVQAAVGNPPATARPGDVFSIADTAENAGGLRAAASTTRYYFSPDQRKGDGDKRLAAVRRVPPLDPGASSTGAVALKVPLIAAGAYFLLACADDYRVVRELDEANNCRASVTRVVVSP